jgi:hypothetical protein
VLACSCRAPTEITLAISTDEACPRAGDLAITVGSPEGIEGSAPGAVTAPSCDASGDLGTIVLVPSGENDARVAIEVSLGDCAAGACIVARRALRYLPHTPLRVLIALRQRCAGVSCPRGETCVSGDCVDAEIADPGKCATSDGCGEDSLVGSGPGLAADAGPDGPLNPLADGAPVNATSGDMNEPKNWATFDLGGFDPRARGFMGAAFDGRFVYLVPHFNGVLAASGVLFRYDTQAPFGTAASWSSVDLTALVGPAARGFAGAAFDGRFLYLVPNAFAGTRSGVVVRYDSSASFGAPASWSSFDLATVNPTATGYFGAVFDGRYVYFANSLGDTTAYVARYDTQAPFAVPSSWAIFDLVPLVGGPVGLIGAVFDGRYVYFARGYTATASNGGVVRYDTQASYVAASSWSLFDLRAKDPDAIGFRGVGFDGRYLHLVPYASGGGKSLAARYDTRAPFAGAGSWELFDVKAVDPAASGFYGAAFDGRYMYMVPWLGKLARFDTTTGLASSSAWGVHDFGVAEPEYVGAAFDGRYLYLAPNSAAAGLVVRFDARSPPARPALPGYFGSFL